MKSSMISLTETSGNFANSALVTCSSQMNWKWTDTRTAKHGTDSGALSNGWLHLYR